MPAFPILSVRKRLFLSPAISLLPLALGERKRQLQWFLISVGVRVFRTQRGKPEHAIVEYHAAVRPERSRRAGSMCLKCGSPRHVSEGSLRQYDTTNLIVHPGSA